MANYHTLLLYLYLSQPQHTRAIAKDVNITILEIPVHPHYLQCQYVQGKEDPWCYNVSPAYLFGTSVNKHAGRNREKS